jgi:uncharacterized membrane protein YhaH (DUF805 family)
MFSRSRPDRDDRKALRGRLNRMDFWAGVALYGTLAALLSPVLHGSPTYVVGLVCLLAMLRLHDIGRRGWWVVLLPTSFILSVFSLQRNPLALGVDISLIALTTLIFMIYVGATPGQAHPNNFGPPPVGLLNAAIKRRATRRPARP